MKNLLLITIYLCVCEYGFTQIDTSFYVKLQNILDSSVSNDGNHGVSSYLLFDNGQRWYGTSGSDGNGQAITDSTVFYGASTTKLNLSILICLLAEDGLIDLDLPWHSYIDLNVSFDSLITIRQLLNHTSGIADYLETPESGNIITSDFEHFFTPRELLEEIISDQPLFPPGTGFQYSNSNYTLAAAIITEITGNPIEFELRNRIWEPLGMDQTYFGGYESFSESMAGIWWNFGNGLTDYSNVSHNSILSFAYGAGNIVSCPKDLAVLLSSLLNGTLVNQESLDEMKTFVSSSFNSWTAGYGLGLHHYLTSDDEVIGHDGYYANLTDMFHSLNCGFILVTMTNTQTEWFGIFSKMYDVIIESCSTLTNEELNTNGFIIYPNPSKSCFIFDGNHQFNHIEIRDITGKVIQSYNGTISLDNICIKEEGIYFVTASSPMCSITKKFLVHF